MKELGIKFDKILCSGHKRAILSAKFLREGLEDESKQIEVFLKAHEESAVYMKDTVYPGLNQKQMSEICEDIVIPDDQKHYFTDQDLGWYHSQKEVETFKEYTERVRDLLKDFRQMEQKDIHTDKTYLVISHGQLLM